VRDRFVIWENERVQLAAEDADLLESACQRIWAARRVSLTYGQIESGEADRSQSAQALIHFVRDRHGDVSAIPSHYIGVIRVADRHYIILPKIYKGMESAQVFRFLAFQFAYAYELKLPQSPEGGTGSTVQEELFAEVLYHSFSSAALGVLRKRSFLSYQEVQENIQTIRGRIDFPRHLRENAWRARFDRFNCIYEVFQEDCLFSRILKYVATVVRSRARAHVNVTLLTELLMRLDDVQDQRCSYLDCLKVRLNRYQKDFAPILQYCEMILSFRMADASTGAYGVDYYLVDTNALFERFVAGYLKAECGKNWVVKPKRRGYLARDDAGNLFQYENDALLKSRRDSERIIVDMKYKSVDLANRVAKYGIAQEDLYQMLAYATRRGIPHVLLVYPGCGEGSTPHRRLVVDNALAGKQIRITACQIPMDSTDREAIRKDLEAAVGTGSDSGTEPISLESIRSTRSGARISFEVGVGEGGQN